MHRLYLWALAFRFGAGMLGMAAHADGQYPVFCRTPSITKKPGPGIARDWLAGTVLGMALLGDDRGPGILVPAHCNRWFLLAQLEAFG